MQPQHPLSQQQQQQQATLLEEHEIQNILLQHKQDEQVVEKGTLQIINNNDDKNNNNNNKEAEQEELLSVTQQQEYHDDRQRGGRGSCDNNDNSITAACTAIVPVMENNPTTSSSTCTSTIMDEIMSSMSMPGDVGSLELVPAPMDNTTTAENDNDDMDVVVDAANNNNNADAKSTRTGNIFTRALTKAVVVKKSPIVKKQKKKKKNKISTEDFCIGDHVYQWCSFAGIPGAFQHHGIVLDISHFQKRNDDDNNNDDNQNSNQDNDNNDINDDDDDDDEEVCTLTIADFSSVLYRENHHHIELVKQQNSDGVVDPKAVGATLPVNDYYDKKREQFIKEQQGKKTFMDFAIRNTVPTSKGVVRVYEDNACNWHRVQYEANFWKRHFSRSGTCTSVSCDSPSLVLSRVYFLLEFPNLLPKYNLLTANCECVAVWCKTGNWATLQASSFLSAYATGQIKSTTTIAAYASTQQVAVPAAGLWGYLGYTTNISLIASQPYIVPAIATYGALTIGGPTVLLWKAKNNWNKLSQSLTDKFWQSAIDNGEMFTAAMTFWSTKHEALEAYNCHRKEQQQQKEKQANNKKNKNRSKSKKTQTNQ